MPSRNGKKILTTHAGSLPRPEELVPLLKSRYEKKPSDERALETAIQQAVNDCVVRQVDCGIDVISDGEMSKISYAYYVQDRLNGLEGADEASARGLPLKRFQKLSMQYPEFPDFQEYRAKRGAGITSVKPPVCTGALSYRDLGPVKNDLARFKAAMARTGASAGFMTAASPGVIAMFSAETSYYATEDEYVFALAEAMRPEYEAIHAAGMLLQIDCPDLPCSPRMQFTTHEPNPLRITARNIEALNHALANIPGDRVRLHLCWGNYAGPHIYDMEVSNLLPLLRQTKARALSFEAANPRHEHEWADWKNAKMPDDMVLIPGVIDSVSNFVEHPRLVAERISRFADIVGNERVIAGVDCGFGTFATNAPLVFPTIVWAKLRSLAEGAQLAAQQ